MSAFWIIVTLVFTFGVLVLVGYSLVRMFFGEPAEHNGEPPTVDAGYRAS